jgi:hypothetical protein
VSPIYTASGRNCPKLSTPKEIGQSKPCKVYNAGESQMGELLGHLRGEDLIAIVAIVAIFGGPSIVGSWAIWLRHRRKELQVELKRDMVAAGMSADEIVRVLEAGNPPGNVGQSQSALRA